MAKFKEKNIESKEKYAFLVEYPTEHKRKALRIGGFEKIYDLKVEGQKLTEIIPFESFGEQWYFWYYEDLKSNKAGSQLEFATE